jgi:hypothetical protein
MMGLFSKKRDAAPQPEPVIEKPAPHVPRKSVFLVVNGRWMEGGEVHTCGRHREISLPVEISSAALRHGHALEIDNPQVARLREYFPPDYVANLPLDITVDLLRPALIGGPKYFEDGKDVTSAVTPVMQRAFEQERFGETFIGTASASQPRSIPRY